MAQVQAIRIQGEERPSGSLMPGRDDDKWCIVPTMELDDLELHVLQFFMRCDDGVSAYSKVMREAAKEMASRMGHELVYEEEYASPERIDEMYAAWRSRDTLDWADMRHGLPKYPKKGSE